MAESKQPPWPLCRSCTNGRIVLLTSIVQCAECGGTGINLSDARLNTPLRSSGCKVRFYKLMHRHGIDTLGQLLCFVHQGGLSRLGDHNLTTIAEALLLLENAGLPLGNR